jgi:hypothetical protein
LDVISVIATFAPELASTLKEYRASKPQDQQTLLLAMLVSEMRDTGQILKEVAEAEKLNGSKLDVLISRH